MRVRVAPWASVATLLLLLLVPAAPATADTVIQGGNIGTQVWTLAGSPYVVMGDVTVPAGMTLTIQPGVEVRMAASDDTASGTLAALPELIVNGSLTIGGTAAQPVRFTSTSPTPAPGAWGGILVSSTTTTSVAHLDLQWSIYGLRVDQAGSGTVVSDGAFEHNLTALRVGGGTFSFLRNRLEHNTTAVHLVTATSVTLQDNAIAHNGVGIASPLTSAPSSFTVTGNTIAANAQFSWDNSGAPGITAAGNWWGTIDPDAVAAAIHDGADDVGLGVVQTAPVLTGASAAAPPVDVVPPETQITAGPSGQTSSTSATLAFDAEPGATYECRLDGPLGAGTFATCTSPRSYSGLSDGGYSFSVRATDAAGNKETTPANRTWTVDTVAPETSLDTTSPPFTFSAETGATFGCSVDGGAFGPCASPYSPGALLPGAHTFAVRARDTAGNVDATPASTPFDVAAPPVTTTPDTTPPAFALTSEARKLARTLDVRVSCSIESCSVRLTSTLTVGGRRYGLATVSCTLPVGPPSRLRVVIPRRVLAAARAALGDDRVVALRLLGVASDAAGNVTTRRLKLRLT